MMRAVRLHSIGGPEVLKYEEVAVPILKQGEALIKVAASGVNFLDVVFRSGLYSPPTMPFTLGVEAAGTVEAVWPTVTEVKVGDRVVWGGGSTYAEYAVAPAAKLVPIPNDLSFSNAVAAMVQGITAHYLSTSTYSLKPGDTCLIHAAAGGTGSLLCQAAKIRGAFVIGTVSTAEKAKLAKEAGADEVINYTEKDFPTEVKRITNGKLVQVVYDSVGKTTFDGSLQCLAPRGTLALFGQSSGPVPLFELQRLNAGGSLFVTRPNMNHYVATREELLQRANEVFEWIKDGKLKVKVKEFDLKDAAEAHRIIEGRGTTGKLVLLPFSNNSQL